MHRLSLAVGRGLLFAVEQSLSSLWLLLLRSTRSRHMGLWPTGLSAPRHVESSRSRDQACVPHMGKQIPNHCTTKETLLQAYFPLNLFIFNLRTITILRWLLPHISMDQPSLYLCPLHCGNLLILESFVLEAVHAGLVIMSL